jgi:serine/threonine-protein kinase
LLDPGTLIAGRYEILSPLASGGSGLIYAATDRTTEKRVAVKVLGPHVLHERSAREKLRLEAIVAGRVESEHIVQVSDAGVDVATGVPFLVMELLKGLDLQHLVEQQGPVLPSLVLEYLQQVASGLDKAHAWKDSDNRRAPIVHRDLKPENLFLTHREDGTPLVKILDFGLAKVLSGSATMSSEVRGTPLYMAPEQLSQAPVTPATDIWAIGLIAFFLLSGKCYWKSGQGSHAILPAVLKEVADGPTTLPQERLQEFGVKSSLTPEFDEWFMKCVNLDPSVRFQTARESVQALARSLDMTPHQSSPVASDALRSSPGRSNSAANITEDARGDAASINTKNNIGSAVSPPGAETRRRGRATLLLALGILIVAGLAALLGKSRDQSPAPAIESAVATRETPTASEQPTAQPQRDAQSAPVASAQVNFPSPEPRDGSSATAPGGSNSAATTATSRSPAGRPPYQAIPRSSARAESTPALVGSARRNATPATSTSTPGAGLNKDEPATAARVHRDPADHR